MLFEDQQDVEGFVDLMERLSKTGHTILDPFCGTGTTLIAGLLAPSGPRIVKGCDSDVDNAGNVETTDAICKLVWRLAHMDQIEWKKHPPFPYLMDLDNTFSASPQLEPAKDVISRVAERLGQNLDPNTDMTVCKDAMGAIEVVFNRRRRKRLVEQAVGNKTLDRPSGAK